MWEIFSLRVAVLARPKGGQYRTQELNIFPTNSAIIGLLCDWVNNHIQRTSITIYLTGIHASIISERAGMHH